MSRISILLVDDNPTFLKIAVLFLETYDNLIVIGVARGGQEGLALAANARPDVVLLDLNMPDLSGLDLIPHLRTMLPQAGIIVLTMNGLDGYREAALTAGADDFVPKPSLPTDLLPAIRRVRYSN